jgi:signal recognition particle subunit SRP54
MFDFLSRKFSDILERITGGATLTEQNIAQALESVKESLLEADVPYDLVHKFVDVVAAEAVGKKVLSKVKPGEQFVKIVYEQLLAFMGGKDSLQFSFQIPSVVMVIGLQGSGKTTSIAKMVRFVQKEAQKRGKKRHILMASVDFYRPAAVDQLEMLSKNVNAAFFRATSSQPLEQNMKLWITTKKVAMNCFFWIQQAACILMKQCLKSLKRLMLLYSPAIKFLY